MNHNTRWTRLVFGGIAAVVAGSLAACGGSGGGGGSDSAGGESVPVGSDASVYKKALKDMDPVTVNFGGMTAGPGSGTVDAYVDWGKRVTKMSGNKIKFKYDYAGAKVPLDKMADALEKGRMDMGMYVPSYEPDKWPVANTATAASMYSSPQPLSGRMAAFAAEAEFGLTWEPLRKEAVDQGIHPLYPMFAPGHDTRLMCSGTNEVTSVADLKGKQVRTVDRTQVTFLEEVGATPVSLSFPELFTGLQRGVVDCAVNSLSSFKISGFDEVLGTWTVGDEAGHDFIDTPSGFGVSDRFWKKLPLAAQQLLWDSQREMVKGQLESGFQQMLDGRDALIKEGGTISGYDDDVIAEFEKFNKSNSKAVAKEIESKGFDTDGTTVVDDYKALNEKWLKRVTDDLGVPGDLTWEEVSKKDFEAVDYDAYADTFFDEILEPNRPE